MPDRLAATASGAETAPVEVPETRYARSGDVSIAYQVIGDGATDVILVPGLISNVDYEWGDPRIMAFRRRLARFSRLVLFDKRGTGLSDQLSGVPTLEQRMDDVRAVLDAVGSERAVVFGLSDGGAMTALFAATHPSRTVAAVIYGAATHARVSSPERLRQYVEAIPSVWGTQEFADDDLKRFAPSVAHEPELRAWWRRYLCFCATPAAFGALIRMSAELDVRHVLPAIRVPTVVLHRSGDRVVSVERGREFAAAIPKARFVELPGIDHYPWIGDTESVATELERIAEADAEEIEADRVLATIVFTDIVGSTERAARVGDREWRQTLDAHHAIVRAQLGRFRGREIDTAGDGFFASFDGPARAIRCAWAIENAVRDVGLEIRAGVHTGECEIADGKVAGIAVHIGARIAAAAAPGEVLVSNTVKDLVAGSGIDFAERGVASLKGVPGEWKLYAARR